MVLDETPLALAAMRRYDGMAVLARVTPLHHPTSRNAAPAV
ncbi:hypothetical protein [Actinoplanes sp. NPDC051851]